MKLRSAIPVMLVMTSLRATPAESAHYRIEHHGATAVMSGASATGAYRNNGTAGETGAVAQSASYLGKGGFAGQIYSLASLATFAATTETAENSTLQLAARLVLDDATLLPLGPSSVEWQASVGPITSIDPEGLLTSGSVYADQPVLVTARHAGMQSELLLIVTNVANDDFGIYAQDGIDDFWQVAYFGENNPDAAADRDPFGSGHDNLFKYTAGLDPLDSMSRFTLQTNWNPALRRMQLTMGPCFETRNYQVVASDDLIAWQPVTLQTLASNPPQKTMVDLQATGPSRYYRVIITIRN
jgi:hypothetical protein